MKKILFLLISVMAIAFTSCKIENATVAAHVEDTAGAPVADRYIFYIDKASYIIGSDETRQREFGVLKGIADNYPKYVISMTPLVTRTDDEGIQHLSLREFLKNGL